MESFNTDQSEQNATDQLTFKVGDREYNAESASTKIANGDAHIAKIEAENAELRAKLESAASAEEIDAKIQAALKLNAEKQEGQPTPAPQAIDVDKLSQDAVQRMDQLLAQREQERLVKDQKALQDETFKKTQDALVELYGNDGVDAAIREKAGVPFEKAVEMARDPDLSKVLLERMAVKSNKTIDPSGGFRISTSKEKTHAEQAGKRVSDMNSKELRAYMENITAAKS